MTQARTLTREPKKATHLELYRQVDRICRERLRDALNPETGLFDRQIRDRTWQSTRGTEDVTSTAIALIGMHRAGVDPSLVGLDVERTLAALVERMRKRRYPGALGLVLWANAVWGGRPLEGVAHKVGIELDRVAELLDTLTTMEVAWLVSGLVHEYRRSTSVGARAALDVAFAVLIARLHGATALFCHASERAPMGHRVRRWVANFADQIYAVQAASLVAKSFDHDAALEIAERCAARLVELQGGLGQWWWHYDPRIGEVVQGFPVYSVHQHAMAPMALLTLAAAGGTKHGRAIERSHAWIAVNELGTDMVDPLAGTIWRNIEIDERPIERVVRQTRSVIGWATDEAGTTATNLKVNHETRPYEWAWCLFAGALASGERRVEHVA